MKKIRNTDDSWVRSINKDWLILQTRDESQDKIHLAKTFTSPKVQNQVSPRKNTCLETSNIPIVLAWQEHYSYDNCAPALHFSDPNFSCVKASVMAWFLVHLVRGTPSFSPTRPSLNWDGGWQDLRLWRERPEWWADFLCGFQHGLWNRSDYWCEWNWEKVSGYRWECCVL